MQLCMFCKSSQTDKSRAPKSQQSLLFDDLQNMHIKWVHKLVIPTKYEKFKNSKFWSFYFSIVLVFVYVSYVMEYQYNMNL